MQRERRVNIKFLMKLKKSMMKTFQLLTVMNTCLEHAFLTGINDFLVCRESVKDDGRRFTYVPSQLSTVMQFLSKLPRHLAPAPTIFTRSGSLRLLPMPKRSSSCSKELIFFLSAENVKAQKRRRSSTAFKKNLQN